MSGKATGKPFVKGDKRAGRPKGVPNKATAEVREWSRRFCEDAQGRALLLEQYRAGTLNPSLLQLFHHYAYCKPQERVELTGADGGPIIGQIARVIIRPDAGDPED